VVVVAEVPAGDGKADQRGVVDLGGQLEGLQDAGDLEPVPAELDAGAGGGCRDAQLLGGVVAEDGGRVADGRGVEEDAARQPPVQGGQQRGLAGQLGLTRPDGPDGPELAPLPGLADLPGLVERVRAAGLPVRVQVSGQPAELPTGVGLSAYRIAQEALTNVLKHAGSSATVDIEVRCGPEAVELTVADTGAGAGGTPQEWRGSGLRGMRERAAMLGGTLSAGDRTDGGFQVRAHLPIAQRA
jgi:hypothetical protein